jgi:cap1 methyltransferase
MITDTDDDEMRHAPTSTAKRQRRPSADYANKTCPRDCYDDVLRGEVNSIRQSWLHTIYKISINNPVTTPAKNSGKGELESLSRQLNQVKRRLWPAAENCARVCGSSAQEEFTQARRICNPFELLGEGREKGMNRMFMNRSAIKLANLDAILDFSLTGGAFHPSTVPSFLFADLAGAPGGFSEYIMKRCPQSTTSFNQMRGYGMSLVGDNEHGHGTPWKLDHVCRIQNGFHTSYRVCDGMDNTGDLYRWENVLSLHNEIQKDLQDSGLPWHEKLHLVVADGGFDAQRDSECQEQLAQKLVVCQVVAGISLLRPGATLVVKMFGFQTDVVKTVMRDLYQQFDQLTVLKPISSRPASSERYVVCSGFHGLPHNWDGPRWRDRMFLGVSEKVSSRIDEFLDDIDRDLLTLNLKACFAILSCLEGKAAALLAGNHDEQQWYPESPAVNIHLYKHAWGLN